MENYNSAYNLLIITFLATFLFTNCKDSTETQLKLSLERQEVEQVFTIGDFCEEKYDSIFILTPYYYTKKQEFANLDMSKKLRSFCESAIYKESSSTILFISNGKVKGHAVVQRANADFATEEIEDNHFFPIKQTFIMDKQRKVYIYNEQTNKAQ